MNIKKEILLCVGISILFLGVGIKPAIALADQKKEINGLEPKDYLVQTIINIANNPVIKELFKQYDSDLFDFKNIDRNIHQKILFRNPGLFSSIIFTRPSLTYEYLDISYYNVIEINYILSKYYVINTIKNVKVTNPLFFNKINDVITKNGLISIFTLYFPYICLLLNILIISIFSSWLFWCERIYDIFGYD